MPTLPYKQDGIRTEMENLLKKLEANIDELPQFTVPRVKLQGLLTEIVTLSNVQDTHRSNKQQTTKRLTAALDEARKLLNFFWVGLKEHYGTRNEKLVEFGLQPYRGRARGPKEPSLEKPKKPAAQPVAPEAEPPKAADSES